MVLTVSATGAHRITVMTFLDGAFNAKPDVATNCEYLVNYTGNRRRLKFALLFSIVLHPPHQILMSQGFRAGTTFDLIVFLDNIVNNLTQMLGAKFMRAWPSWATAVGAKFSALRHAGSSGNVTKNHFIS